MTPSPAPPGSMPACSPLSFDTFQHCQLCPRQCGVNRFIGTAGFCRTDAGYAIASITRHRGEEPALTGPHGICNVFFSHCNLRCCYCQNVQISHFESPLQSAAWSLERVAEEIITLLATGCTHLGFVSPSHMIPQMVAIIGEVRRRGYQPVIVYNSNGYDRVSSLRLLEDWVDVYLPDYKYSEATLATQLSGAAEYPEVAARALIEMYRQKGSLLHLTEAGLAERGLIVRHLVLPGAVANSLGALRFLAQELSPRLTLSLMSQYNPVANLACEPPLNRRLFPEEYARVVEEMEQLGFENGWIQAFSSADCYNPDFNRATPFENAPPSH